MISVKSSSNEEIIEAANKAVERIKDNLEKLRAEIDVLRKRFPGKAEIILLSYQVDMALIYVELVKFDKITQGEL